MVNQAIVEGLKLGLYRGETLKQAMMSFFNAGYKKQEIEEAARALHTQQDVIPTEHQVKHIPPEKPKKPKLNFKPLNKPIKKTQVEIKKQEPEKPKQVPKQIIKENVKPNVFSKGVSHYGEQMPNPKTKLLLIVLLLIFLCFLGVSVIWFFFKEEFVSLISGLTG